MSSLSRRIVLLKLALSLAFLSGMLMSIKLWVSSRSYPLSPMADWMPVVLFPFDYILFVFLLALLILAALAARPRIYIAAFLVLIVLLGLTDQSRWQPWVFQYAFMFAALAFYTWKDSDIEGQKILLNTCRLIVICLYVWSGVQKLNFTFLNLMFPSLINPYLKYVFGTVDIIPHFLFITIPLIEICIGIGLWTRRFRDVSVVLAVLSHLLILLLFIPVRRNSVVWPWNIAMIGFVIILFWQAKDSTRDILLPKRISFHSLALVAFGIMPVLNLFGLWDSYLSSSLYSGKVAGAVIYVNEPIRQRLPLNIQSRVEKSGDKLFIHPCRWAMSEMNVPCYPEKRVFKSITRQVCKYADDPPDISLRFNGEANVFNGVRQTTVYYCSDL